MKQLATTLMVLIVAGFLATAANAEIIFLKDGRLLHVKVLSGDDVGIQVERLDNHGKLFIRWELLREEDRLRLRIRFGLEDDNSGADLQMDGHRVFVRRGDYYDGLIEEQDQNTVTLRRQDGLMYLKREAVLRIEERPVSVFEIYTPEELYKQRADEIAPEDDDVVGHLELAKWATKVGLYGEALIHYAKITEVDPEYKKVIIENQVKRLEVLDKDKEIRNAIRAAEKAGFAHKYPQCLAYFDEILASSSLDKTLKKEVQKKKLRFLKRRWKHYSQLIVRDYHREVNKRIKKMASSKDIRSKDKEKRLTVSAAMNFMRSQLHKEIVTYLAERHQLDPKKEVEEMWKNRKSRIKRSASYGSGTFIVEGKKGGRGGAQQAAQNRALQEALDRLRRRGRGSSGSNGQQAPQQSKPQKLVSKEGWWRNADSVQRAFLLKAYYAEKGGHMEVVSTSRRSCPVCGGAGNIKQMGAQGGYTKKTCPRCQGLKSDKLVYYR